jgi:hypothetical protein
MKCFIQPVVVIIFLFIFVHGNSQEAKYSKNSLFIEFLGNGGLYSINYERNLKSNFFGRLGIGHWSSNSFGVKTTVTSIPILLSYITGNKRSHFEFGGGLLAGRLTDYSGFADNTDSASIFDLTGFFGYRYQKSTGKGFLFRVGLTPFLSLDDKANYPEKGLSLSGGISYGYHF